MVNLTAAERVYEYWIDKASSAADLVLKIVFAVILFLVEIGRASCRERV